MRMLIDRPKTGACCWLTAIDLQDFPNLLHEFVRREPDTRTIEQQARQLIEGRFNERELEPFIKAVCRWGGYAGVAGKVRRYHPTTAELRSHFQDAYSKVVLSEDREAIKCLLRIKGLAVSFASKHLKSLAPDRAVVLDSIISARLGYPRTPEGYERFVGDCRSILARIASDGLSYPGYGPAGWRVSDVEMAIYQKLRPVRS
jgi:hypothetical protein